MKRLSILFIISFASIQSQEPIAIKAGIPPLQGEYPKDLNALHYNIEIGIGKNSDWFEGYASIRFLVEKDKPKLSLDFTGLYLDDLLINGNKIKYKYINGVIKVNLNKYKRDETIVVDIRYHGIPDDGLIINKNIHGDPTIFVDNWPNRTRFWLPSIDHPSDKATVNYTIHAPVEWKVIANGYRVSSPISSLNNAIGPKEDRLTWKWDVTVPIPTYNMVFGAGKMDVELLGYAACDQSPASQRQDNCVEVSLWVYPEDKIKAKDSFRRAVNMVDYFTKTIGPFPFEKLANVQSSTRFGGMENASAIFYSEKSIGKGRNIEGTVSHEIAHQWFGDSVTEADWNHLWLSEGFATYFGNLFFEDEDGEKIFQDKMENNRKRIVNSKNTNRPIIDPENKDLFKLLNSNNYPKGGWVLHMLRGYMGDELFFNGIRKYYELYKYKTAMTKDFQSVMENIKGENLDWFFEQWLYKPGFPIISYEEKWNYIDGSNGSVSVKISQIQKSEWPIFIIPTEICWGKENCKSIRIDKRMQSYEFDFESKPQTVGTLDPKGWILKDISN